MGTVPKGCRTQRTPGYNGDTSGWEYGEKGLSVLSSTFQIVLPQILNSLSKKYGEDSKLLLLYIVYELVSYDFSQDNSGDFPGGLKQRKRNQSNFSEPLLMKRVYSEAEISRSNTPIWNEEEVTSQTRKGRSGKRRLSDCENYEFVGAEKNFCGGRKKFHFGYIAALLTSIVLCSLFGSKLLTSIFDYDTSVTQPEWETTTGFEKFSTESREFVKAFDKLRPEIDEESCLIRSTDSSSFNVPTNVNIFVSSVEAYETKMRKLSKYLKSTVVVTHEPNKSWNCLANVKLSNSNSVRNLIVQQDISIDVLASTVKKFEQLKSLVLYGATKVNSKSSLQKSNHHLVTHSNLETLKLVNFNRDSQLPGFAFPKLKNIVFKNVEISPENSVRIREILVRNKETLVGVHFFECDFNDAIFVYSIDTFPKLKTMTFSGNSFLNQAISNSYLPGNLCRIFPNLQNFVINSVFNNAFHVSQTCKNLKQLHVGVGMESNSKSINYSFIQGLVKSPNLPKLDYMIFSLFSKEFSLLKQFHFLDIKSDEIDLRQSECHNKRDISHLEKTD